LLSEALDVARRIQDKFDRANALSGLVAHLPDIASEVLDIARSIQSESQQAITLSKLAPHLTKNLLSEALNIARDIQSGYDRDRALSGLAPYLPENPLSKVAAAIIELISHLTKDLLEADLLLEVLDMSRSIQPECEG
jgi:hypothetical protein